MGEIIKSVEIKGHGKEGKLTALLKQKFPSAVLHFHSHRSDETVVIEKNYLEQVCLFLRAVGPESQVLSHALCRELSFPWIYLSR